MKLKKFIGSINGDSLTGVHKLCNNVSDLKFEKYFFLNGRVSAKFPQNIRRLFYSTNS